MKYRFIEQYQGEFRVAKICRVLKVSRSGYYAWRKKPVSKRRKENEKLLEKIRQSHSKSRRTYGSPRITADLRAEGQVYGKNRVARLMRENGIVAKTKKKFKVTTNSKHGRPVAENLLKDKRAVTAPNKVWVSDITYVWTKEGWLYLMIILDVFSRNIVGWSMSDRLTSDFVLKGLWQALGKRKPGDGLIFHSDRGVQYTSYEFRMALRINKMLQSMSGKGNCYDNAFAESFFHTLKTELVYGQTYNSRNEARQSIFEYIEVFYNRERRHSSLGYVSPVAFEQNAMAA